MVICPTGYVYPGMHPQDPLTYPSPYNGKTRYHYFTGDGHAPNDGAPPCAPQPPYKGMPFGAIDYSGGFGRGFGGGFGGGFVGGFGGYSLGYQYGGPGLGPFTPSPTPPAPGFGYSAFGGAPVGSPAVPPGPTKPTPRKEKKVNFPADPDQNSSPPNRHARHSGHRACSNDQPVCSHNSAPACGQPGRPANNFDGTCEREGPNSGARGNGMVATPNNATIAHAPVKVNIVFNVFEENIITKAGRNFGWKDPVSASVDSSPFFRVSVSDDTTMAELIMLLDCKTRANTHPPWNEPGHEYPEHAIGVQEMLQDAGDRWTVGTKIMLGSTRAPLMIKHLWREVSPGPAQKPIWLVRWPC